MIKHLPTYKALILIFIFISLQLKAQNVDEIKNYLKSIKDSVEVSLLAQDVNGNILLSQNPDKQIPSASIIKIPILISLYEEYQKNKINLDEVYKITKEDIVGGSGELQLKPVGQEYTLRFLSKEMIRTSDNTATNILIKKLGFEIISKSIKEKGLIATQLNRLMMDFDAIKAGRQNFLAPSEINKLLLMLYNKKILTHALCDSVIATLKNCNDRTTIPRFLPEDIPIAHKTGSLDYVLGDAAIIYSENPIVLSVMVEKFSTEKQAAIIIGRIGEMVYNTFGKK